MDEQIPSSNLPPVQQGITPEQLEQLKARAREAAILQTYTQQQQKSVEYQTNEPLLPNTYYMPTPPINPTTPKIIYVKRSLTVAEIILMLFLSCGIVFGMQVGGGFLLNNMPRIEIKLK